MRGYATEWQTRNQSLFYLFGIIVLIIGFFRNTYLITLTGVGFICIAFLSKKYLTYMIRTLSIDNVDHSVRLSIGDQGSLNIAFVNSSHIPFFGIHGRIVADPIVTFHPNNQESAEPEYTFFLTTPPQKKVFVGCPVKGLARGTTRIRSFELVISDPLHINSCVLQFRELLKSRIIVYPRPEPIQLNVDYPHDLGNQPIARSYFQDDTSPSGIRDYATHDPFKHIHWKASARIGRLQTKTYDHVTNQNWTLIFLNSSHHSIHSRANDFEERVSVAAWMTQYARKHQIEFSIYTNSKTMGKKLLGIDQDQSGQQLKQAWELLSFLQHWQIKTAIPEAMRIIDQRLHRPQALFILTLDQPELGAPWLAKWMKDGHKIYILKEDNGIYHLEHMGRGGAAIG
ncbi:DUF58 domain-containing protein [Sporolactobacillus kofuensis]|uniref:DUF58 domain-containing protein n=1 Tax=Sporolactobacillus kofuensis TaxID=269672 RepID=A0ABW1WCK8_9BACL|nr:DUF58 domain-containing protein [Sporolactobacillus kofuensis]MCO7174767.1 DUF58 domain-containing protein [Sporolactobacillus kofuensis]